MLRHFRRCHLLPGGLRLNCQWANQAPTNHSPLYFVDEPAVETGVKAMVDVTVDYLNAPRH